MKYWIASGALVTAGIMASLGWSEGDELTGYFGLEVNAGNDAAIEVLINGVPFGEKPAGVTGTQSLAIHGEVVPGTNRVDVLIGTADISPAATEPLPIAGASESLSVTVKLQKDTVKAIEGGYETDVTELDEISWRASEIDSDDLVVPTRLSMTFSAPEDKTPPSWMNADKVIASTIAPSAIASLQVLRQALVEGDVERFGQMNRRKYADAAQTYPLGGDAGKIETSDVMELKSIVEIPGVSFDEIDDNTSCKVFADDRLIQCFGTDGEPALRANVPGDEMPIFLPVSFSVIGGKLVVIR